MKKLIVISLILAMPILVPMTIVAALDLSYTADMETEPVKLTENHVAIAIYGWDKDGKRTLRGYEKEHYGLDKAQELLTNAYLEQDFWDMNSVEAIAYAAGEKTKADADVAKYENIISKFNEN